MPKLKEILQNKIDRENRLKSSMESITRQLVELGALKIILFGSLAEGRVDVYSDLDLLAIMPSEKTGKEWIDLIYENVKRGIAADIIAYNKEEMEKKLPTSSFLQHVLISGRVIYEKT
jgi:predicted nucleotidyltransferase